MGTPKALILEQFELVIFTIGGSKSKQEFRVASESIGHKFGWSVESEADMFTEHFAISKCQYRVYPLNCQYMRVNYLSLHGRRSSNKSTMKLRKVKQRVTAICLNVVWFDVNPVGVNCTVEGEVYSKLVGENVDCTVEDEICYELVGD